MMYRIHMDDWVGDWVEPKVVEVLLSGNLNVLN